MPRKQNPDPLSAQQQQELVSEGIENFELPKSVVMKIAKSALPDEARLTKDTVLSLVKGSTVFINYLAATAHDVAVAKQHKSIAASDVLRALELLDFADLVGPLQAELSAFKDTGKTTASSRKSAANASTNGGGKSLSISIPPTGSASAANLSAPRGSKVKLTVRSEANGNGADAKGKGKAPVVDADGDTEMHDEDEEEVGNQPGPVSEGFSDGEDDITENSGAEEPPSASPSVGGDSKAAPDGIPP
ncbi:histone-fold-containing protein [Coprinopsis marcescibilis]|uniref:DNA polymerase epsilon subunit D n=1 Tax=Coprinopsis marcescibilis TaxID=230819 RepID=A0A5C3KPT4_COPMA|nr:histone-fold-containing protein [Coprinopsis marcescibilis]